jgi:hypothetical protein
MYIHVDQTQTRATLGRLEQLLLERLITDAYRTIKGRS